MDNLFKIASISITVIIVSFNLVEHWERVEMNRIMFQYGDGNCIITAYNNIQCRTYEN